MLDQEWEHLWPRTWLYAGVASDVSEPVSILFLILGPNRFWFHILMKVKYLLSIMHVNIEVPASWLMNVDGSKFCVPLPWLDVQS